MNTTPSSERIHIAFFGNRNAGKSSIMNRVIGQDLSIVSEEKGTTTDPVRKSMELLPLGPVVMVDTPGLDDEGELGEKRVGKARRELTRSDVAVIVLDGTEKISENIFSLFDTIRKRNIPFVVCINKMDIADDIQSISSQLIEYGIPINAIVMASAADSRGIEDLKKAIIRAVGTVEERPIIRDMLIPGDYVILVIPIDKAAPKGRLILPQQQTMRDILDGKGKIVVINENEVASTLAELGVRTRMIITDSQVFGTVARQVPENIPLTSFSILMARYKGNLENAVKGVAKLDKLKGGERILIAEGCTHHRQCGDIGSVKIPKWIREHTGKDFIYEFSSGTGFPEDLSPYSLVIHCGGCMLTEKEMKYRYALSEEEGTAITNYGILIAHVHGILRRSLSLFPEILAYLQR